MFNWKVILLIIGITFVITGTSVLSTIVERISFPYYVRIHCLNSHGRSRSSGGALIGRRVIATSARNIEKCDIIEMLVTLAKDPDVIYAPTKVVKYNGTEEGGSDDLAVLILERCVTIQNGVVETIDLPHGSNNSYSSGSDLYFRSIHYSPIIGSAGDIECHGYEDLPNISEEFNSLTLTPYHCQELNSSIVSPRWLCTDTKFEAGQCCHVEPGSPCTHNGFLVGVTAHRQSCANDLDVLSRVEFYFAWLREQIELYEICDDYD